MARKRTFNIDPSSIERIARKFGDAIKLYDIEMERRTKTATHMVWAIAHQKRPYISTEQMKAQGRSRRVSDPGATLGVPVDTGLLQSSITEKVERITYGKFRGIIETHGIPYASAIEYGTSSMKARPFMRPAILLTQEAIKKLYGLSVISKISQ
jgi:hypothetical protein